MRILSLVTNDHAGFFRQQVAGLRARGHTVDVLAVPGYSKEVDRDLLTYAGFYTRAVRRAFGGYDVVHANYGLTAPPAIAQLRRPVVLTFWGSDLMGRYGRVSRLCSRLADEVVVMSEEMAEYVPGGSHVIPHGVDLDLFRPIPRDVACREVGWNPEVRHVLFPYDPSREVKDFSRAQRLVRRIDPEGDALVELHAVSGVDHDRMPLYMNAADTMLLTSKREGMPNSVKEALACNLPIVSTDVSDLATLLAPASHSVVDDDDDVLVEALRTVLFGGERSNGRTIAEPLGVESQLDKLEAVYQSAVTR